MKSAELVKTNPIGFPIWQLNEDTGVFWTNLTDLEDNGFQDPWFKKINLKVAKRITNRYNEVIEYRIDSDCEDHPVELIIINE